MADFSKVKPSKNIQDYTGDKSRPLLSKMLWPYAPWETGDFAWTGTEKARLRRGEDVLSLLRERMKNNFLTNFFTEGPFRPAHKFDFHREIFDTHSNMRKRSQGSSYDNY